MKHLYIKTGNTNDVPRTQKHLGLFWKGNGVRGGIYFVPIVNNLVTIVPYMHYRHRKRNNVEKM